MSLILIKKLLPQVSTEALVEYMKCPAHNQDEQQNDLMFDELLMRGFFLPDENLEKLKD